MCLLGLAGALCSQGAAAELLDAAARLNYGYYTEEPRVVRAAYDALERMPDSPGVQYYRALAAMRLFELGAPDRGLLMRCIDTGEALAGSVSMGLEGSVLVAACSALASQSAPLKSVLLQRRRDAALERILAREPAHPRALWIALWGDSLDALQAGRALHESQRRALEETVEAFRHWEGEYGGPDWGHAEALAHLGAAWLAVGDARRGRDLLEEALLVAPDYRLALELMGRLKASR